MVTNSKPRRNAEQARLRADRTVEMGKRILGSIDSVYSRKLLRHLRAADWKSIVCAPMPMPSAYADADAFAKDWLAYNLLRKYPDFKIEGIDARANCWSAFAESEATNLETNCRLLWSTSVPTPNGCGVDAIFLIAQRKIRETIGRFSWDKVLPYMGHSSGATAATPRVLGAPVYKYRLRMSATPTAVPYVLSYLGQDPLWVQQSIRLHGIDPDNWVDVVGGERLDDVEKNATTRRTIGIQPSGNLAVQRGFGGYFRNALRNVGVDLNDQSINQRLALHGSLTDLLTTWDGKNASNSITCGLMQRVFLEDQTGILSEWYEHLNNVRCHLGVLPARASELGVSRFVKFQLFSAMGNGFTFELESLLFWAFASATAEANGCEATISVYGDDVIIDKAITADFIHVMQHAGLYSNVEKTFSEGPFRESCGKHYFNGAEVTPFYIDKPIDSAHRMAWLLNSIRIWCSHSVSTGLHGLWSSIIGSLPYGERRFVDASNADAGIMATRREAAALNGTYLRLGWRLRKAVKRHGFSGCSAYLASDTRKLRAPCAHVRTTRAIEISRMYSVDVDIRNVLDLMRGVNAIPLYPKRGGREWIDDVKLKTVVPSSVPEPLWPLVLYQA